MLPVGEVLDHKYEILKEINRGGTAIIYLAMNQKLNQQWVVKEISCKTDDGDEARALKIKNEINEAYMMKEFDHPSIPRIVDILDGPDSLYIIMDYISGQSLAERLKEKTPISQDTVVSWAKQICEVLRYLHAQNPPVIYHDLKPGNVMLKEPEHNVKLIDFGEARQCVNGNAPGGGCTPRYAAPEQQTTEGGKKKLRGKTDERTDIYCFGTTLYRLLTKRLPPPYPEPVGSVRAAFPEFNISRGMDNIIQKCTEPDPRRRFQTADELMNALDNINLWDESYLKKQKNKVRLFFLTIGLSVLLFVSGVACAWGSTYLNAQTYDALVQTEAALDYEVKVANYLEAIALQGDDPRAYAKLVEAYEENRQFGDYESQQLATVYNANKAGFDPVSAEVLDLNYAIGRMYFNMYSGESNSFRSRILKAQTYFSYVVEYADASYPNAAMANNYYLLCDFFTQFVLNDSSVQEPTAEEYQAMLDAVESSLVDMQSYASGDAAYTRLNFYQYILDMLNANIRGLAQYDIDQAKLTQIIEDVMDCAANESVTQNISLELQAALAKNGENVLDNVQREYSSLERGQ